MIVIIGGGLAGLSTAFHLGEAEHVVLEASDRPGGLCATREIDGFYFDATGHLLHLRDPRAIELVDLLMPGVFEVIERRAAIRSHGVTLPFPYQANLHGLPAETVAACVVDFVDALGSTVPDDAATSFEDWSRAVFGEGISRGFMFPYNRKLFRREPSEMTADWVSWAVPRPSLEEVVRGALGCENVGMGYNPAFRYPAKGGISVVPDSLADRIGTLRCNAPVARVDLDARTVVLEDGESIGYDRLVVTSPLPSFLAMARGGGLDWAAEAGRLDWSVVGCLNLGIDREGVGDGHHWVYFPDDSVPFYRVGFPSNFSSAVAPPGTSSLYVEFGLSRDEPWDPEAMEAAGLDGLRREGILRADDRILVSDWIRMDPGYVIFDRARQEVLERVVPALESAGVVPIGRYGAWTYSYMERAILDGLETAEMLLSEG